MASQVSWYRYMIRSFLSSQHLHPIWPAVDTSKLFISCKRSVWTRSNTHDCGNANPGIWIEVDIPRERAWGDLRRGVTSLNVCCKRLKTIYSRTPHTPLTRVANDRQRGGVAERVSNNLVGLVFCICPSTLFFGKFPTLLCLSSVTSKFVSANHWIFGNHWILQEVVWRTSKVFAEDISAYVPKYIAQTVGNKQILPSASTVFRRRAWRGRTLTPSPMRF